MHKFVALDIDRTDASNSNNSFPYNGALDRRRVVLSSTNKLKIREALQRVNFKFHRTCSFSDLLRECNAVEGQTLLMFWACDRSDATMSESASLSSVCLPVPNAPHEQVLRSVAQQTDISCRNSSGLNSPVSLCSAPRGRSPAAAPRSGSILGSVCALLLSKQESNATTKQASSGDICRICFGGESAERLVRPCSCRGTIAAVHRTCLERWLLQAATSSCELCRHHYAVTRSHKWSWARALLEWARAGRARALAADAWRGAALGAVSLLGTARALAACDRVLAAGARRGGRAALAANLFSSLLIGVVGALNGLLTTWVLLKVQEHQLAWQAWRDSTLHVHVALSESPSDRTVVPADAPDAPDDPLLAAADP